MNLANNNLSGTIPNSSTRFMDYPEIDLSSNDLEGSMPPFLFEVAAVDVSKNRFSNLDILCHVNNGSHLSILDLSHNELVGELPDCWLIFENLEILVLANNKLSGKIPTSIGSLTKLTTLHLSNNSLSAELPASLKNCKDLVVFDVEDCKLSGPIPAWIGQRPSNLLILSLNPITSTGAYPRN
ncbi:LRR domain containing protein [Parasponia andersonii]|uniref:LRR domain containing protein n=1 Tax=Parasponia andersonii TaxID=3476 RepID=A0A2P5AZZ9_PARAD|nr:LRR domain containing protein [Parasponia andersonii]